MHHHESFDFIEKYFRPADWFSQKNCALQYNQLLGKTDTPRRKRGEKAIESVETPGETS